MQRAGFLRNLSTMADTLRSILPGTALWALHTTALPLYSLKARGATPRAEGAAVNIFAGGTDSAMQATGGAHGNAKNASGGGHLPRRKAPRRRMELEQVALTNAAIASLARARGMALADWASMLHLGWPRDLVLADDIHPRRTVNSAFANVYLHALAML